jgi:hypothetical protein
VASNPDRHQWRVGLAECAAVEDGRGGSGNGVEAWDPSEVDSVKEVRAAMALDGVITF